MDVALPRPSWRRPNIGRSLANSPYAYRLIAKKIEKTTNRSPAIKDKNILICGRLIRQSKIIFI